MITKLRASKLMIETPREGAETWVHITIQQVTKTDTGEVINVIPRYDYISFPIQDIGMDNYEAIDPVTSSALNVTGYGVSSLLYSIVIKEMISRYGGTVTKEGDLIV